MTTHTIRSTRLALFASVFLVAGAADARAQAVIKVNDDVNFKLGVLGQFQADWLEDPGTDANIDNLFVRRVRLMFGGQVARNVTFFVETDTPNLGKVTPPSAKNITPGTIIQDAYADFKVSEAFMIDAGLMFVPFSHNSLQSAATLLPVDYGAYTFSQSTPTQSSTGRDTGFQARGYFMGDHLEYRLGAFQGARDPRSHNSFRYVGRVQYNFFDTDNGFFYAGTSLGKKRIVSVGVAFDAQKNYNGVDADAFVDWPAGPGAFTGQFDYNHFDGDVTFLTLPKQDNVLLELGYLVREWKLTPVLQYARRDISDLTTGDENRVSIGANYWWAGHNANIKAAFTRIAPAGLATQHEVTVQLQIFYF
jgi:hypothetical protein